MTKQQQSTAQEDLLAWRDYIETAEVLRSRLTTRLQSESGLSSGDYHVLVALSRAEGRRLRSSVLAEHVGWERSRLSHHLGRMEKRGLIAREDVPDDSRAALVVLTRQGLDSLREASHPHLQAVHELFLGAYSSAELARLRELMGLLRTHLGLP